MPLILVIDRNNATLIVVFRLPPIQTGKNIFGFMLLFLPSGVVSGTMQAPSNRGQSATAQGTPSNLWGNCRVPASVVEKGCLAWWPFSSRKYCPIC